MYPELRGLELGEVSSVFTAGAGHVRHTIGLADALTAADLRPEDRVDDGLPQDLEASIRAYGLRYFKVKLSAALDRDVPRLRALVDLLARETAASGSSRSMVTRTSTTSGRSASSGSRFARRAHSRICGAM